MNIWSVIGQIVVAVIDTILWRWRRDGEMRQKGRDEVLKGADDAATKRLQEADALRRDWDSLDADQRERVRDEQDIYRD